jgi:5-methylthioadenosine/S-adenosylhomocysteine deaminase
MSADATLFLPDSLWDGAAFQPALALLEREGEILAVGEPKALAEGHPGAARVELPGQALFPGTVNAHNHSFQSLVRGFGDDLDFFGWRDQGIYKHSLHLDAEGVRTGALLAFAEMLRYGVTTVVDFFYLHGKSNERDLAVIGAAQDLGIRLVHARCLYDGQEAPELYRETPADAVRRTRDLAAHCRQEHGDRHMVTVHPAPHSPHAASPAMVEAGLALAEELDTPFHMHMAEGQYEVALTNELYGLSPLRWLDSLGGASERALLVHCVWLDDGELDLMAERGISLLYNPASNMFLGDGITRIRAMMDRGIRIALATDGACSNNRTSVFDEMRTCALLQKVTHLDGAVISAEDVIAMGTSAAGEALRLPIGRLAPGHRADLVSLDLGDISLHPPGPIQKHLVYAMDPRAITGVWVDGRRIFADGDLLTVPLAEVTARVRALKRI